MYRCVFIHILTPPHKKGGPMSNRKFLRSAPVFVLLVVLGVTAMGQNGQSSSGSTKPENSAQSSANPPASRTQPPAESTPVATKNFYADNFLLGDWGGLRSRLAEKGVNFDFSFTQFVQAITHDEDDSFDHYVNRFDAYLNIDTEKAGLWKGGGIGTHFQIRFGSPHGGIAVFPANAALITPTSGEGRGAVTSLYLTQKLGTKSSIMFGKIDTLDLLAGAPYMGGRGVDGFMHIAFAGPPSGVAPVSTYGALFSTRFKNKYGFSLFVFDPKNQTDWGKPFTEGINFGPSLVIPATHFGQNATHTFGFTITTQKGTDLRDIPQVILPESEQRIGARRGAFNLNYTYEQNFYQNPQNAAQRWGMFARIAVADANPNILQNQFTFGVAGTGVIPKRKLDRFGLGVFTFGLSDALRDVFRPLFTIQRETGAEVFYNFAVTPWLRTTADFQVLPPTIKDRDTRVYFGWRTKISF